MPQLFVVDEQGRNQEPVSNDNPLPSKIVRPVATYAAGAIWDAQESGTVSSTVFRLNPTLVEGHETAFVTIESQAVRFWLSGTDPTSSAGHVLEAGDDVTLESFDEMDDFRVTRRDGSDAEIHASFGNYIKG